MVLASAVIPSGLPLKISWRATWGLLCWRVFSLGRVRGMPSLSEAQR